MSRLWWWVGEVTGYAIVAVGLVVWLAGDDQGFQIVVGGWLTGWGCALAGALEGPKKEP